MTGKERIIKNWMKYLTDEEKMAYLKKCDEGA